MSGDGTSPARETLSAKLQKTDESMAAALVFAQQIKSKLLGPEPETAEPGTSGQDSIDYSVTSIFKDVEILRTTLSDIKDAL